MSLLPFFIPVAFLVGGMKLFGHGRLGVATDDHPVCAGCGFDLFGQSPGSRRCPECGASLASAAAVRWGNRRRRESLVYAGLATAAVGLLILGRLIVLRPSVDLSGLKPDWWLIQDAESEHRNATPGSATPNTQRLLGRLQAGTISMSDQHRIVIDALAMQADLTRRWNPQWGDMIELLRTRGRVSTAEWQQYLDHDEPFTADVPTTVPAGQAIRFKFTGQTRGGSSVRNRVGGPTALSGSIDGVQIYASSMGHFDGADFGVEGTIETDVRKGVNISPGPKNITLIVTGYAGGMAVNPGNYSPMRIDRRITILPPVVNGPTTRAGP